MAITTLMHERATLAFGLQIAVKLALGQLIEEAKAAGATTDPQVRDRLAQLYIEAEVLRLNAYRGLTAIMRDGVPGPEGSLGKWQWAEVNQALTELAMDLRGPRAVLVRRHVDLPLPARPRQLDRGRDDRDPQEHRRRARARAAADALMNFDLTDDQRSIQRTARDFLAARYKPEEIRRLAYETERGFTDEGWADICELGWPALLVDEEHGGLGLGVVELAVVQEELGAALAPSPFLSTVAAAALIADAGSDEQRARWLPGLAAGEARGTVAIAARRRGLGRGARRRRRRRGRGARRRRAGRWPRA